jgi:hypothetical protein
MFSTIVLKFGGIELRPAIRIDVLWKTYSMEPCIHYPNDS